MKERNCKIVRDLFPSYIDGLTNEETNLYIEDHLNNCEQCKEILENMQKELIQENTKKDSREVKYIKKYNKKLKILKIVLIGILAIFLLTYIRKMVILISLNNKISSYRTSVNYYIKSVNYCGDSLITIENYKKDDKYIMRLKDVSETNKIITTDYFNGETLNSYTELNINEEGQEAISRKGATLNKINDWFTPVFPNYIEIDHPITFLGMPLLSSITSEECNGKDCYRIVVYSSLNSTSASIYYIEKDTGLVIRIVGSSAILEGEEPPHDIVTDIQYKFDVVNDDDFSEPDISEYEIQ